MPHAAADAAASKQASQVVSLSHVVSCEQQLPTRQSPQASVPEDWQAPEPPEPAPVPWQYAVAADSHAETSEQLAQVNSWEPAEMPDPSPTM